MSISVNAKNNVKQKKVKYSLNRKHMQNTASECVSYFNGFSNKRII